MIPTAPTYLIDIEKSRAAMEKLNPYLSNMPQKAKWVNDIKVGLYEVLVFL